MKLTCGKRIALELLGPAALGAGIISLFYIGAAACDIVVKGKALLKTLGEVGSVMLFCLMMAYLFVGIQSILYTIIMEWRFKRGLDPRSWRMIGLSSSLGFSSDVGMIIVLEGDRSWEKQGWIGWGGLGLVVGFLMGLLIRCWSKEPLSKGEKLP